MRALQICLFVIALNFGFCLISPCNLFGGHVGPAGKTVESFSLDSALVVGAVIGLLMAGGAVIAGWTFKTSSVLSAFLAIYVFSVSMFTSVMNQMINAIGVDIPSATVFTGVILALYATVGVFGALQLAGTPAGTME